MLRFLQGGSLMTVSDRAKFLPAAIAIVMLAVSVRALVQADAAPNSQPNPYRTIENWAKLPEGRTWGSTSAVDL